MKRLTYLILLFLPTLLLAAPGDIYVEQDAGINYMKQKKLKMPDITTEQTTVPVVKHFSVSTADIVGLGAATSGDITLTTLPAKSVILATLVKHSAALVGPSISAGTARVITAGHNYGTAFNIFQAAGATTFDPDYVSNVENYATTTPVLLHVTSTGANLSVATAGAVDVYVSYVVLP